MIPDERLAELEATCSAASPGPWRNGADPCHFDAPGVTDDRTFAYWITNDADARFVAVARTAVPELLAEVRRLQQVERDRNYALQCQNERLEEALSAAMSLREQLDDSRAENASLRDAAYRSRADLLDAQSTVDQLRRDYLTVVDAVAPETGSAEHAAQIARKAREDYAWWATRSDGYEEEIRTLREQLAAATRERDVVRVDLDQANRVAEALRATRDEIVRCAVEEALEEQRRSARARGPR